MFKDVELVAKDGKSESMLRDLAKQINTNLTSQEFKSEISRPGRGVDSTDFYSNKISVSSLQEAAIKQIKKALEQFNVGGEVSGSWGECSSPSTHETRNKDWADVK